MRIYFLLLSILFMESSFAQMGTISGKINDDRGKAVSDANITLSGATDSVIIKFTVSDQAGIFEFTNLAYGSYKVSVSHSSFLSFQSDTFLLSITSPQIVLPAIKLEPAAHALNSVTVVSKKRLVELKSDRIIVNVDAGVTNAGSNALELLEKSPNVSVSRDGEISIKGKQGIIVLLDGRPLYLKGQDLSDYLKGLSSSQLEQLEIITQPSAKYDASGMAGVINLKTKRNKQIGFNGTATVGYMQTFYPRSSNSFSLNYRNEKLNAFISYSYSFIKGYNDLTIRHTAADKQSGHVILFDQFTETAITSQPHNIQTGLNYFLTNKTSFGVTAGGQLDVKRKFALDGTSRQLDMDQGGTLVATNYAQTVNAYNWKNLSLALNLKHQFTSKREISADGNYLVYDRLLDQTSNNYLYDANGKLVNSPYEINPYLTRGNLPSLVKIYTAKADYSDMISSHTKIELGWKSGFVSTDNNAFYEYLDGNQWKKNDAQNDHFLYKENINALYASMEQSYNKLNIQIGLRAEETATHGIQLAKYQQHDTSYLNIFPNVSVKYIPNESNQFYISYNKRIDRPNYPDMNPFRYFFDKYTYLQGNPFLLPQMSQSLELGYHYKESFSISASYSKTGNVISEILKQTDSLGILYQTKENVSSLTNLGVNVSYYKELTHWLTASFTTNIFNNRYRGLVNGSYLNTNRTAATFNLNLQFQFLKEWKAELSGYYNTETYYNALTSLFEQKSISFGFAKPVLKGKGTVKINIRDPFSLMSSGGETHYGNVNHYVFLRWNSKGIGLTFTYRFGNSKLAAPAKKIDSAQDEKKRVD